MTNLSLDAVMTVMRDVDGQREIDFKRYAHCEKACTDVAFRGYIGDI
jgi:hypothetical protein